MDYSKIEPHPEVDVVIESHDVLDAAQVVDVACIIMPVTALGREWFAETLGQGTWVRIPMSPELDMLFQNMAQAGINVANTVAGAH